MNKFKLFPLALAAFAFSACTSEVAVENNPNVEGVKSYVAVNINNVGANGTRADGGYEEGADNENAITKVRFYFFTQDGKPYKMTDNTSFVDATPTLNDGTNENVEKFSDAILVIEGASKTAPYSMMAVANPQTLGPNVLKDEMSKPELEVALADKAFVQPDNAADVQTDKAANGFVMTSSVYAKEGKKMWTADISGFVQTTAEAAKASPVDIFVERVATKLVTVTSGISELGDATPAYPVGETTDGRKVFAKIKGWGLADQSTQAKLIKDIDPTWTDDALGFSAANPWNVEAYHRCFWENSVRFENGDVSYNDLTTASDKPFYTLPNTTKTPEYVVAAELVYHDGTPAVICSYKGVEYLSEGAVKNVILAENKQFYKKTGETATQNDYSNLLDTDITFVVKENGSYEVKAQLNGEFELYTKGDNGAYTRVTPEDVNAALGTTAAQVRKGGMTYYHTKINHFGKENSTAQYGLVRNHVYKIDIKSIKGFGTPVYDPNAGFDPKTPEKVETFLAAKINVLSWRVVSNEVNLGGE